VVQNGLLPDPVKRGHNYLIQNPFILNLYPPVLSRHPLIHRHKQASDDFGLSQAVAQPALLGILPFGEGAGFEFQ
jgi:hypothetical protein